MIGTVLAMLLATDALRPITNAEAEADHWAEFSRSPTLISYSESVLIGQRYSGTPHPMTWMRHTATIRGVTAIRWADSRTCPAMMKTVATMRALPSPQFQPQGVDPGYASIRDGVVYSLTAPAGYDDVEGSPITIWSNLRTPLANWIDGALKTLEPCWSSRAPLVPPIPS